MTLFSGKVPLAFSLLTLLTSGFVCYVLLKFSRRFYHLWNRIAAILFAVVFVNTLVRIGLEIYDIANGHSKLSEGLCSASFGIISFLSTSTEALYVCFLLTLFMPRCTEPAEKKNIDMSLIPLVVFSFAYATIATATPLFSKTTLVHHHSYCFVSSSETGMRIAFFYAPTVISVLVSGAFVLWILNVETRISKFRILSFGIVQLLVVSIQAVFAFIEASNSADFSKEQDSSNAAVDAFSVWLAMHESVRSLAFVVGERLYPNMYLRNCNAKTLCSAKGCRSCFCCCCDYSSNSGENADLLKGNGERTTTTTTRATEQEGTNREDEGEGTGGGGGGAGGGIQPSLAESEQQHQTKKQSDLAEQHEYNQDEEEYIDESQNVTHTTVATADDVIRIDDTLTYFVRVMQRNSADGAAYFAYQQQQGDQEDVHSDFSSVYGGGRARDQSRMSQTSSATSGENYGTNSSSVKSPTYKNHRRSSSSGSSGKFASSS